MTWHLKKLFRFYVVKVKRLGYGFVSNLAVDHVGPQLDLRVIQHGLLPALVGDLQCIGQCGVSQRQGRCLGHAAAEPKSAPLWPKTTWLPIANPTGLFTISF